MNGHRRVGDCVRQMGPREPPDGQSGQERIAEMLGRSDGSSQSGAGERIDVPPGEAAECVVEYPEANDLL